MEFVIDILCLNIMGKYQHKYRIASIRASFWNYGWNAAYFITICTQNRDLFFGDISQGKMSMSAIGHIANSCWHEIPNHFPFVQLGPHITMPNHIHGIVMIENNDRQDEKQDEETQDFAPLRSF
ncbi:transposase [Membranihabitans marinus]|uniref:transposase n=1 Tax=Membranihabitans marinus TaxID=1227546 RepID=UPI001F438019|nr:transposase [Membranihabitans marinus]